MFLSTKNHIFLIDKKHEQVYILFLMKGVQMPTYEYQCEECESRFEEFQPITAPPITKCQKCKGKVIRLIGRGGAVIFKGSGFYQTDYRSPEYKEKEKRESKSQQKEKK